jgi:hypothetical protein
MAQDFMTRHLPLALSLVLATGLPAAAGDTTVGTFEPGSVFATLPERPTPGPQVLAKSPPPLITTNPQATGYVTATITNSYRICASLTQKEYTVDCLGERLEALVRTMPETGDYAEARQVLEDTAQKLRSLAQQNRSPTLPRARISTTVNEVPVTSAPLTPVRTEAVEETLAEAVDILDEAATTLLRSAANSAQRAVSYQAMAQAVGSNKVLLRAT